MSHYPRKRFGQHFLTDEEVIQKIVRSIAPHTDQPLVEIGPGLGALTVPVLSVSKRLDVVELDREIIPKLKKACASYGELVVHQGDATRFDLSEIKKDKRALRVFGNLPYNISTPLLFHLLKQKWLIKDMYFMLQKEVAERMAAAPGCKAYGRLSVMVQYHCSVEVLFFVGKDSFSPPPKVESAVVRLIPYDEPPFVVSDEALFDNIVKEAFSHRRKTLHNALKKIIPCDSLLKLGIDPNLRPEQLSLEGYVQIANCMHSFVPPVR